VLHTHKGGAAFTADDQTYVMRPEPVPQACHTPHTERNGCQLGPGSGVMMMMMMEKKQMVELLMMMTRPKAMPPPGRGGLTWHTMECERWQRGGSDDPPASAPVRHGTHRYDATPRDIERTSFHTQTHITGYHHDHHHVDPPPRLTRLNGLAGQDGAVAVNLAQQPQPLVLQHPDVRPTRRLHQQHHHIESYDQIITMMMMTMMMPCQTRDGSLQPAPPMRRTHCHTALSPYIDVTATGAGPRDPYHMPRLLPGCDSGVLAAWRTSLSARRECDSSESIPDI
jgi:hypothetical protein